ncbi:MAG: membrane protein insertase YidC, partial [Woeseiaceae bacterium]
VQDYAPRPPAQAPVADETPIEDGPAAGTDEELPALAGAPEPAAPATPGLDTDEAAPGLARPASDVIRVRTDVLDLQIDRQGGTLRRAVLLRYPVTKDHPDTLIALLESSRDNLGLIQTGLRAAGDAPEPNHLAEFSAGGDRYELGEAERLVVPLTWTDGAGLTVRKDLVFTRGSYRIDVRQTVINDSDTDWRGAAYARILRRSFDPERSMFDVDTYSFSGPVIYDGERSEKLDRDDLLSDGPLTLAAAGGWVASIQHHFLSAVVPPPDASYRYSVTVRDHVASASTIGPTEIVAAGAEHEFETILFVGPKLQAQLEKISPRLKLTVDYGWLTIIAQPLFWLLSKVHAFVGNWGVSIILVTVLIKLAFYKLTQTSGRSMAKMREIQPRMKALQERYKDDRQQLSQAMMELYKREKVNPAAGCLPILIQMPFFLAFYWVLLESVEMRQAPFALWISDLSTRDPYFILPLIMGAAMYFQQKLNPAPADPVQAKVMQIMPIVFTGFFAFFPSGLVLYWVTNTVLSIAQQWQINRVVHAEAQAAKGGRKKRSKADANDDSAG